MSDTRPATDMVEEIELIVNDLWNLATRMDVAGLPGSDVVMRGAALLHDDIEDLRLLAEKEEFP